jgi:outer membrane protein TolC
MKLKDYIPRVLNNVLKTCLFLLFFIGQGIGQETLTLKDALTSALENNYGIQIAVLETQADQMAVYKSNVGMGPVVDWNLNFSTTGNYVNQNFIDGRVVNRFGRAFSPNTNLTIGLPLYDGGRMQAAYEQLALNSQYTELQGRIIIQNTLYSVMETYYDIIRQSQTVAYLEKVITYYEELVKITEERWNVGQGSKIDFLLSKTELNAQLSELTRAKNDLRNAKTLINGLLNRDPQTNFEIEMLPVSDQNFLFTELESAARNNNREILLIQKAIDINRKREEELEAAMRPVVGLSGSVGYSYSNTNAGFLLSNQNFATAVGVSARWNLYDGNNRKNQLSISRLNSQIIETQKANLEMQIINDLVFVFNDYKANKDLLDFEQANQVLAEENLNISIEKFRLGGSSILELNEAQRAYDVALNAVVEAEYDLRISELELLRLSGRLTE